MSPSDQDTISGAEFTTAAETVKKNGQIYETIVFEAQDIRQ